MEWKFQREEKEFPQITVGEHRARIKEVEKSISKNGNDMLIIKFEVSGNVSLLWHYIVFLNDRPEITNANLTALFDAFDIPEGDFDLNKWTGKTGGIMVKHDEEGRAKLHYFLNRKKFEGLPAWEEVGGGVTELKPINDDELPF